MIQSIAKTRKPPGSGPAWLAGIVFRRFRLGGVCLHWRVLHPSKIKVVLDKSWVYMQRAHLHAGGMGTTALALIVLVRLLGASGGFGYSAFWMWAGSRAPALGSTGLAKESLKWLAMPSSGAFVLATIAVLVLLFVTLVRRQPGAVNARSVE